MSQLKKIKIHLEQGNAITSLDALHAWGCFRLAARIKDLRDLGMEIITNKITLDNGKQIAEYKKNPS